MGPQMAKKAMPQKVKSAVRHYVRKLKKDGLPIKKVMVEYQIKVSS